jgi:hypothetical protein
LSTDHHRDRHDYQDHDSLQDLRNDGGDDHHGNGVYERYHLKLKKVLFKARRLGIKPRHLGIYAEVLRKGKFTNETRCS